MIIDEVPNNKTAYTHTDFAISNHMHSLDIERSWWRFFYKFVFHTKWHVYVFMLAISVAINNTSVTRSLALC
jgi:hypothetical protein